MFLPSTPPLIGYHGNNKWPIPKFIMTYIIVLKVIKFGEDRLNRFWNIKQKPSAGVGGGHFGQYRVRNSFSEVTFNGYQMFHY